MRRKKAKRVAALLGLLLFTFSANAGAQTTGSIAENPDVAAAIGLLESYIDSQITYEGLPGISLAIVHDQELVWSRGYGFSDLEEGTPATPETIYRIGSISKLFTAIAVLRLRDEGKLRLDDRVDAYLPWFRPGSTDADAPPITIRHLLTHTSGLPADSISPGWDEFEFPSSAEIAESIQHQDLVLPTQSRFKYSNLGFAVAGELVAAVADTSFDQFVSEQILAALSMNDTFPSLSEQARARLANGYGRRMPDEDRRVMPYSEFRGITPAAGFSTTVNDLARLASWQFRLLDGGTTEVLEPYTLREMQSVEWLHSSWQWGWGLGFELSHTPDRDLVGHGGLVGGYRSGFYLSPKEKVAVIALANAVDGQVFPGAPYSIIDRAFEWVAPAIRRATEPPPLRVEPDPEWYRLVGTYRAWWTDMKILVSGAKLLLIYAQAENPGEYLLTLVPAGADAFRVEGDGFDETGELVTFESDSAGQIVGMRLANQYFERVDRRENE